ncbi:DNA-binding protein [Hallella absiana]|uniref:DNA-binding protein n=1 Tax=Hallella absiana TaxID=2925336 RepID=UPI0021C8D8FD|nr:DNA-binding protein [Hallella absiana]
MHTAIHTTTKRTLWTPDHDDILKERFHTDCLHDIATHIGCTCSTVSSHARRLGLRKISPSGRNCDARSFVLIEYPNLSYQEMAERTGLHRETIRIIARELGLERTQKQLREIRSRRRKELIQKERRRIIFGLDQKTNIKVVSNHQKIRLRGSLKRLGYILGTDGHTFYYYPGLRRHPIKESNGRALGFTFLPLPTACTEETIHDSASPAMSVNGQTIN